MRLINTSTRAFEEFIGSEIPPYAILSHTWEEEEVSYKDYVEGTHHRMKGFWKIVKLCELAKQSGLCYAWIDTCCIDKRSSAELTEAINSMFKWYRLSSICYAFLSDLKPDGDLDHDMPKCRWFTRGWTLQELIAPTHVRFFDMNWACRGSKLHKSKLLSKITGIDAEILRLKVNVVDVCVAQRMSWAARRCTTRLEDMAYCLLGIFQINMALLYGEGEKAFQRLQEEIIRSTSDLSIFAWTDKSHYEGRVYCGFLARLPSWFEDAGTIQMSWHRYTGDYSLSNSCVRLRSSYNLTAGYGTPDCRYLLPLCCFTESTGHLAIRMRKVDNNTFLRDEPGSLFKCDTGAGYTDRELLLRLTCPPLWYITQENKVGRYMATWRFTDAHLPHSRKDMLRIEFGKPHMRVQYDWGCFEAETHCFFNTSIYSSGLAALRFGITLGLDQGFHSDEEFAFFLFITKWAPDRYEKDGTPLWDTAFRCYLLETAKHKAEIIAVTPYLEQQQGIANYHVKTILDGFGVNSMSKLLLPLRGSREVLIVFVERDIMSDPSLLPQKFARLKVSYELRRNNRVLESDSD